MKQQFITSSPPTSTKPVVPSPNVLLDHCLTMLLIELIDVSSNNTLIDMIYCIGLVHFPHLRDYWSTEPCMSWNRDQDDHAASDDDSIEEEDEERRGRGGKRRRMQTSRKKYGILN
eukprot:15137028-Ditylum_brightwellii.AAC.1